MGIGNIHGRKIVVVGTGIQGLLTAMVASLRGYGVELCSAGNDPRALAGDTRSATTEGEAGRFITILEGHPYLASSPMYPDMIHAFDHTVSKGGWLGASDTAGRSSFEREWLAGRREAQANAPVIAKTFAWYVATSRRAMSLWMQMFASQRPLFAGTSLVKDTGVLRLYDREDVAQISIKTHTSLGVLKEEVSLSALAATSPHFARACDNGAIKGALRVEGYTLNIKQFVNNILNWLEAAGVQFRWNHECLGLVNDHLGRVSGLQFANRTIIADDYVITCGAYSTESFMQSLGIQIAGLAGRWLLLPRPSTFTIPTKAHFSPRQEHGQAKSVVDLNFSPYYDSARKGEYLAIGGGYYHVGSFPFKFDADEQHAIDLELERAVKLLMPDWFATCESRSLVVRSNATCVRSLTPDDQPALICKQTDREGHLIVHAGLNTGTTSMAPAIATSIIDFLSTRNRSHLKLLSPSINNESDYFTGVPGYVDNNDN